MNVDIKNFLGGLKSVLQTVVRLLTNSNHLRISWSSETIAPGWTDGFHIYWSEPRIKDHFTNYDRQVAVASTRGLTYHETAHVLYSPQKGHRLSEAVIQTGANKKLSIPHLWECFNILEDQRAETYFLKAFPGTRKYFLWTIMTYILENERTIVATTLPLLYGRKYLPVGFRARIVDAWNAVAAQAAILGSPMPKASEVMEIIDEYITLRIPKDEQRMLELVEAFYHLLYDVVPNLGASSNHQPWNGSNGAAKTPMGTGHDDEAERELKEEVVEDRKAVQKAAERSEPDDSQDSGSGDSDGDDSQDSGSGDSDDDSDDSSEQDRDNIFAGMNDSETFNDAGMTKAAKSALENLLDDSVFVGELQDVIEAASAGFDPEDSMRLDSSREQVSMEMRQHSAHLRRLFAEIQQGIEAHYVHGVDSGVINVHRAMTYPVNHDPNVWSRWEEGAEDDGGLEIVILVDVSDSMDRQYGNGQIVEVSKAAWVLADALSGNELVNLTTIGYNTFHKIILKPHEQVSSFEYDCWNAEGGTSPRKALDAASAIFYRSNMPRKAMIILTDGQWVHDEYDQSEQVIRALQGSGVQVALYGLDRAVERWGTHSCNVAADIRSGTELVHVTTALIRQIQAEAGFLDTMYT